MPAKKKAAAPASNSKRQNLGAMARNKAMQHLIDSYPEAWNAALRSEREKVGLPAEGGRETRLQKLVKRMLAEGVEIGAVNEALKEAGFKVTV